MKKVWIVLIIVILLSACDNLPAETSIATMEATEPADLLIDAEHLSQLILTNSISHSNQALRCAWQADGTKFWVQDLQGVTIYALEALSPQAFKEITEYAVIYDVAPDGRSALYSQDGLSVSLIDLVSGEEKLVITPDFRYSHAFFSADGRTVGFESHDNIEITLFSAASGEEYARLRGFETAAPAYSARFSADGNSLIWFVRGTVQGQDIESGRMLPPLKHEDFVSTFATSANGSHLATAAGGTHEGEIKLLVTLWDPQSGEKVAVTPVQDYVSSLSFSPDDTLLAAGSGAMIDFISVPDGETLWSVDSAGISDLEFSPNGEQLLACTRDGAVTIWEIQD